MSSNQRKSSIQPRATKASMLRQQQLSGSGLVTATEPKKTIEEKRKSTSTTSRTSQINNTVGASEGIKTFMAQQRARLQTVKKEEEPVKKKKTFMTGAERYGGGFEEKKVTTEPRKLQFVIKQAKASGKLDISSRGLTKIPDEIIRMYHVDPNSIVVDFSSSGDAWYDAVELTKFSASDNSITEIDEQFGLEFGALTHIDFRDNRLTSLPDTLQNLQNLTSISLSYNQFEQVPPILFQLKQVKELILSHNKIKGEVFLEKATIEKIDLSYNEIQNIRIEPDFKYNISKLDLSHNQIEKLPSLENWTKLQELNINQNKLKHLFPASNSKVDLLSLVRLDAGNNLIKTITLNEKVYMPKLIELSLLTNKLEESGLSGLSCAPNLQVLDISSNQLKNVPSFVIDLAGLERLDIRNNQLHTLPYELGKLEYLKSIRCDGNPMRSVTSMSQSQLIASLKSNYQQLLEEGGNQNNSQVSEISVEEVNENVQTPNSRNNNINIGSNDNIDSNDNVKSETTDITDLSQQFSQKVNVSKKLELSNKNLSDLTADILNFPDDIPGIILLDHNVFTTFPFSLNSIANFIVQLNLEHNRITNFSFTIKDVTFNNLKTLKLSNNRLKSIECSSNLPTSFPKLEDLSMNYNSLTTLPENLPSALPLLRVFTLSSNKLDNITEKSFSKKLEILDLSNNDIGFLPPGLSTLENLKELIVFGNRFRIPRPAIVEQGTRAILEFLKRRHNTDQ